MKGVKAVAHEHNTEQHLLSYTLEVLARNMVLRALVYAILLVSVVEGTCLCYSARGCYAQNVYCELGLCMCGLVQYT